jgi:hypothetical protein
LRWRGVFHHVRSCRFRTVDLRARPLARELAVSASHQ